MTNPNLTQLALLVDRSGSMQKIKSDAEGGVKALIAEQRTLPGDLWIDLFQFDDTFEHVTDVDAWSLQPRGMTALLDAIGKSVTLIGEKLAALPEDDRPGKIIFQITTDGLENASLDWDAAGVRQLIQTQTDQYGWEFHYSGANQDAFSVAKNLNIPRGNTISYVADSKGTRDAYSMSSSNITRSRSGT